MRTDDHGLPLTEREDSGRGEPSPVQASCTPSEADIRRLVVAFYGTARTDALIGPIFDGEVDDWEAHFDRMCDFWSSAILKTGRYSGRPAMKHFGLGLSPEHFDRWLGIWERTAAEELGGAKAAPFVDMGRRMARSMMNVRGVLA